MEWNCGLSLTTPAGTIDFDAALGDAYQLDPTQCSGLDMVAVRSVIDDAPVSDGGIVFPFFKGARHITLGGNLIVRTGSVDADYVIARTALEVDMNNALESIQAADGSLTWTLTSGLTQTIAAVRCDIVATYPGVFQKTFVFGLVAANPVIS